MASVTDESLIDTPRASQNATRFAFSEARSRDGAHHGKTGRSPRRRMEVAAARLRDAAMELEVLLGDLPDGNHQDDVHEALGRIMETQRVVAIAHARLRRNDDAHLAD